MVGELFKVPWQVSPRAARAQLQMPNLTAFHHLRCLGCGLTPLNYRECDGFIHSLTHSFMAERSLRTSPRLL